MKKRILSLVLCAAMLLSMCLFLGAGVVHVKIAKVDGDTVKADTWYKLVNGEIMEA